MITLLIITIILIQISLYYSEHFHQSPELYKLSQGWQEPGLWRPRWILDRIFDATEDNDEYRDRLVIRLKNDRSVKLYTSNKRPLFELFKPKSNNIERKRKLFESGDEEREKLDNELRKARNNKNNEDLDGVWTWQETPPAKTALVKIQTNEGEKGRFRHDIRCRWGKLDGYAALFLKGKIYKYQLTEKGLPLGTEQVGRFSIRVSPHRPLISKEYVAFQ